MSDATRRAVVERLTLGPASASDLAEPHGLALPSFMRHLAVLEEAGLIETVKQGRSRICRLAPGGFGPARSWMEQQAEAWEAQTDRLASFLADRKDLDG